MKHEWRIRIGFMGDEIVAPDMKVRNWAEGRSRLAEKIIPFLTDSCVDCRLDGTDAFNRLAGLGRDEEFSAEIDGNIYELTGRESLG